MPSHNLGKLTQSATDAMNDKDAKDVPLRFASSNDWASRQPQTNAKPKFLKKKFQIGSIKGQQNFRHEEHAFHPDEIAPAKMKNKEDLRKWKKYKNQGPFAFEWALTFWRPEAIPYLWVDLGHYESCVWHETFIKIELCGPWKP